MTQGEINEILLNKKFNEFYLVTLECEIKDEEFASFGKKGVFYEGTEENKKKTKKLLEDLFNSNDKRSHELLKHLLKGSGSSIRKVTVVTLIDGKIYDTLDASFLNFDDKKIIDYANILNYFSESELSMSLSSPSEMPGLKEDTVLIGINDEVMFIYENYMNEHFSQRDNRDKRSEFMKEIKRKTLKL